MFGWVILNENSPFTNPFSYQMIQIHWSRVVIVVICHITQKSPFHLIHIISVHVLSLNVIRDTPSDPWVRIIVLIIVPKGPALRQARDGRIRPTDLITVGQQNFEME